MTKRLSQFAALVVALAMLLFVGPVCAVGGTNTTQVSTTPASTYVVTPTIIVADARNCKADSRRKHAEDPPPGCTTFGHYALSTVLTTTDVEVVLPPGITVPSILGPNTVLTPDTCNAQMDDRPPDLNMATTYGSEDSCSKYLDRLGQG